MQPPFDCTEREREELGDARGGPLLIIEQLHDHLQVRGQVSQERADVCLRLGAKQFVQRSRRASTAVRGYQAFEAVGFRRLAATLPHHHTPRAIAGNGAQPAREFGRVLQFGQRLESQQKGFLRHILCGLRRTQNLFGHKQHRPAKSAHQFITGFQTAQPCDLHQFPITDKLETALYRHVFGSSCAIDTSRRAKDSMFFQNCGSRRNLAGPG